MIRTLAKKTKERADYEIENAALARKIAQEGIVLLKNDGGLPLKAGSKIALYGEGAVFTVKGGIGSGEVNARYTVSIWDGLKNAGLTVTTEAWLLRYQSLYEKAKSDYTKAMQKKSGFVNFGNLKYLLSHPFQNPCAVPVSEEYISEETDDCIYVISRQAGENVDRMPVKGEYLLSDHEIDDLKRCCERYGNVILVVNVGGYMDLTALEGLPIKSILFFAQQGAEGGNALADIISGRVSPSGHLSATWAKCYDDIPFGGDYSTLNGNTAFEEYREGVYVGYRYFDSFHVEPQYPFGYGLSYTDFSYEYRMTVAGTRTDISATVRNTGKCSGRAVVQIYASCPAGKLDKEYQRLAAFGKTKTLAPGETQTLTLSFPFEDLKSFDETSHSFLLEKGDYLIRAGAHSRNTEIIGILRLDETVTLSTHREICKREKAFDVLTGSHREETADAPVFEVNASLFQTVHHEYGKTEGVTSDAVKAMQGKLTDKDLVHFTVGDGLDIALPKARGFLVPGAGGYTTSKFEKRGIPSVSMCDGPAGLRVFDISVKHGNTVRMGRAVMASFAFLPALARLLMIKKPRPGKTYYQYATAFPVGMSLAQTWNTPLVKQFGEAVQTEMEALGCEIWLAPGMNIYRNPLCGRNYEYFSEDPLLSGRMAAAVCQGAQSRDGFAATIKHFCCNNQEVDRRTISENVSERALREIYLRNFEIAVKEGKPKALMTAYNKINGIYAAENRDLVTGVLRNEWGFDGLVMTDWTTEGSMLDSAEAMKAGVDLMMPGICSDKKQIKKALRNGSLDLNTVKTNAGYVLKTIAESRLYNGTNGK